MYVPHANTVHMSHQGLSGTSVGPRTTFLLRFQDPGAAGLFSSIYKVWYVRAHHGTSTHCTLHTVRFHVTYSTVLNLRNTSLENAACDLVHFR